MNPFPCNIFFAKSIRNLSVYFVPKQVLLVGCIKQCIDSVY